MAYFPQFSHIFPEKKQYFGQKWKKKNKFLHISGKNCVFYPAKNEKLNIFLKKLLFSVKIVFFYFHLKKWNICVILINSLTFVILCEILQAFILFLQPQ